MRTLLRISVFLLLTLTKCSDNDLTNPFDPETPKDYWTPESLEILQISYTQVQLTWIQPELNIDGFKIDRRKDSGEWQKAFVVLNKDTFEFVDNIPAESSVNYEYRLYAYAGNNMSNVLSKTFITEVIPDVITSPFYLIKSDIAIGSGKVTSSGSKPIISRGICYNIDSEPTIDKDTIKVAMGEGLFQCYLNNLVQNKTYFIRAYCITTLGVVYGNSFKLKTPSENEKLPNMEKVLIQGGTFIMGDDESTSVFAGKPEHLVTLNNYYIGKYEATIVEFCLFLNESSDFNIDDHMMSWRSLIKYNYVDDLFLPIDGNENLPVSYITWEGANKFCIWAGGRLPTEAEWEYSARGGSKSEGYKYSGSNDIYLVGWSLASTDKIQPVGLKKANELGLYDMSGNVSEMCSDWYDKDYYYNSPVNNPQGPLTGEYKVLRGGSIDWSPLECTYRLNTSISSWGSDDIGFRIVFNSN